MVFLSLIILAIIQGLTEFIPVSSSAHLYLGEILLSWEEQGTSMVIASHLGSLGAVLLYFRHETAMLFRGGLDIIRLRNTPERQLFLYLTVATVPLVLVGIGLAISGIAENLDAPVIIALASIFFGVVLYFADRQPVTTSREPSSLRAVIMLGLAQALAAIPGTSRSGITITAARCMGFDRESSARFSMLMAIPAIMASGAYLVMKYVSDGGSLVWGPLIGIAIASFISAFLAIDIFMRLTRHISFTPFVIYRVLLGVVILTLVFFTDTLG